MDSNLILSASFPLTRKKKEPFAVFGCDGVVSSRRKPLNYLLSYRLKRLTDIAASACALLLFSPVFLWLFFVIRRDGGPALFSQNRVGCNGRLFKCWKFRSMVTDADQKLLDYLTSNPEAKAEWDEFQKLKEDPRITPLGKFIRKTSIDELPQLWNVLKGEMSLVGPRPILPEQQSLYGDNLCFYIQVNPGITGPWQVSGRNKLTFAQRISLEKWYASHWSYWMDIMIILKTFPVLLNRENVY